MMIDDKQKAEQLQDMLQGSINQRNASQNECLQLAAQVAQLQRDLETAKKELLDLRHPELPLKKPNGQHAEEAPAS